MSRIEENARLRQRVKNLKKQLQLLEHRYQRESDRWQTTIHRMARYPCQTCCKKTGSLHRCFWCDTMVCHEELDTCVQCKSQYCGDCFVRCRCGVELCMPCSSNEPSICRGCGRSRCHDCSRESRRPLEPCQLCGSAVCADCSPTHKCNVPDDQ